MTFFQSSPNYGAPITSQAPEFQGYQKAPTPQYQESPDLLSILAQSAGSGLGQGVATGIQQQIKKAVLEKALGQVKPNMSALERARVLGGAGEQAEPYINSIFQSEAALAEEKRKQDFERQKAFENHQYKLEQQAKKPQKIGQAEVKQLQKEKEAEQSFTKAQQAFDGTAALLKKGNLGNSISTFGKFNRERQKDIGKMNFLRQNFEGLFRTMVNTGRITDQQYSSLMSALPDPYASDMDNLGRLEGIGEMTGLDMSSLKGLFERKKESPKFLKGQKAQAAEKSKTAPNSVVLTDPNTGEQWNILEENAEKARAAGWK